MNKPISPPYSFATSGFLPQSARAWARARIGLPSCSCENAPITALLDKKLAFVTGKGGVGKTTVAYALGLRAAAAGHRAIVCEIASQERGSRLFGKSSIGFNEVRLSKGLWAISIDPDEAIREYLEVQLPVRAMGQLLHRSRLFSYLAAATPGLTEMVTMGKVWELALNRRKAHDATRTYDLVIVDAPATGHGVGLLQTPRNFAELARVGPLANQASKIEATIDDQDETGVVIVAGPEEMAVNESAALEEALTADDRFAVDAIYANAIYPQRFGAAEVRRLEELAGTEGPAGAAIESALSESRRAAAQRAQLDRLDSMTRAPITELPFIFAPTLGPAELGFLSRAMG